MSSPFAELERKLERIPISRTEIERLLEKVDHDLDAAAYNREKAPDWALKMTHEAILSGCAALMAAHGYRSKVNGHHYVALRFAQLALPSTERFSTAPRCSAAGAIRSPTAQPT